MGETATSVTIRVIEPFMMDLVKSIYGKNLTYAEYAKHLNFEFAQKYIERDVWLFFEPTVKEETIDLQLMHANIS